MMTSEKSRSPWARLHLRGRLLLVIFATAFAVLLLCVLSFYFVSDYIMDESTNHARQLGELTNSMASEAIIQQETNVLVTQSAQHAAYLNRIMPDYPEASRDAETWAMLVREVATLSTPYYLNTAEEGDLYIRYDGEFVASLFLPVGEAAGQMDAFIRGAEPNVIYPFKDLDTEFELYPSGMYYNITDNPGIIAWDSFDDERGQVIIFYNDPHIFHAVRGLADILAETTAETVENMRGALPRALLILLAVFAALLLFIAFASRRLALVIVNPVEEAQRRQELALEKAAREREAIEQVNRLKTEFISNVSHELRTPLTVVSGYAQSAGKELAAQPENQEIRRRMKIIASEADRLAIMVEQVLDVSRIEEDRMIWEQKPCQVSSLIQAAVDAHFPILNKNSNRLELRTEGPLPMVFADPQRTKQVIINLLANAMEHTEQGLITISATHAGDFVEVRVADNGKGIPADLLPHVFERFTTRRQGEQAGTGLGLYISKHIVEAQGGEISIESEPGEGTAVTFTLPLYRGEDN